MTASTMVHKSRTGILEETCMYFTLQLEYECFCSHFCLSNRKFERLGDPLDEIVTISVHKYNVIMPRPSMTL